MSNPDEELDLFSFAEAQEARKTAEEPAAARLFPPPEPKRRLRQPIRRADSRSRRAYLRRKR